MPSWLAHEGTLAATSFLAMARLLPAHVRSAAALAWRASRRDTVLAVGLTAASGWLTVLGLLATQNVAQALLAAGPTADRLRQALPALILVAGALAVRAGLASAAGWAQARLAPQVTATAETTLVELTTSVELADFDDPGFADEMERARERGTQAASGLVERSVDLLTGAVGIVAATAALMVIHPLLVPLVVIVVAPVGWAAVRAARLQYVSLYRRIARRRRLWMLQSLMAGRMTAAELRSYQMRGFLLDQHRDVLAAETAADLQVARGQALTRLAGAALSGVATAGAYGAMAALLLTGRVPLAASAAGVVALQTSRQALHLFVQAVNGVYEEALYFTDFLRFCERARRRTADDPGGDPVPPFQEVTLTDVGLRYTDATVALDGVNLVLRRGETIALVGENGSGKTSLARVLALLYTPTSGEMRWDGVPVAGKAKEPLRRHVAVVSQDYWHWPFTAGENIRVGDLTRADTTGRAVRAAAEAAGVHSVIQALPRGYDTLLDRTFAEGQELSGGQWQRLAVARALLRDAPLLICDEPSAALDPRAEHAVFRILRRRGPDRTTVLISHRLANVRHVDRIYVLHGGRLVEQGSHDELLSAGGRYADLFRLQASGYAG